MALWTLLIWLAVGAVAGILARNIMGGTSPFSTIGDVILGMVGAVVVGYFVALFGVSGTGGIIGSIVAALLGAMLIIWGAMPQPPFPVGFPPPPGMRPPPPRRRRR